MAPDFGFFDQGSNHAFSPEANGSFANPGSNPILGSEANGSFADPDSTPEISGAPPSEFEALPFEHEARSQYTAPQLQSDQTVVG